MKVKQIVKWMFVVGIAISPLNCSARSAYLQELDLEYKSLANVYPTVKAQALAMKHRRSELKKLMAIKKERIRINELDERQDAKLYNAEVAAWNTDVDVAPIERVGNQLSKTGITYKVGNE